ncbi:MAG: hypothetical protein LQ346_004444 [Caloplaca aetnensis]|nr:MAG: hypothetical protein LQ346_004444 [Caloplaca aetnensis]
MSSATPPNRDSPFLGVPLELRNRIYKELLVTSLTKTPKPFLGNCRSATRYDWNLHPSILATNRQIHDEARSVLGIYNEFVVVETAAKELEQKKSDMRQEDTGIMQYRVKLWPGKKCKIGDVPNERMRIWLGKEISKANDTENKSWIYVVLVEELRDLLVGLSIYQGKYGPYRILGLVAKITVPKPVVEETQKQKKARERRLLDPVMKLRLLSSVEVQGVTPGRSQAVSDQLRRSKWDHQIVYATFNELLDAGNQARQMGHNTVSSGYYRLASDYVTHFMEHQRYVFTDPIDPVAFQFKIHLQRSRTWIEAGYFEDALGAAEVALNAANAIFRTNVPAVGPPPIGADGRAKKGPFRKWTCECIKDGAVKYGQRIKAEEIGAAYYYKSIAEYCADGDSAAEQAEDDKMLGIGCCAISDTAPKDCIQELLDLDRRTMERLMEEGHTDHYASSDDEWEDVD